MSVSVTVWNEYRHEQNYEEPQELYPDGMHALFETFLSEAGFDVRTATLDEPEHGLTEEVLDQTDVLTWWGHMAHDEVDDDIVERVKQQVLDGMGLIVLHSGHFSKVFKSLMGTTCNLKWRVADDTERLWVVEPGHRIAEGLDEHVEIPEAEMYGERFDVPPPDDLVFVSWFEGGEVFRSGCCYHRGNGRIFYFRPGHETYPIYHQEEIQRIIRNAIQWAAPTDSPPREFGHSDSIEKD